MLADISRPEFGNTVSNLRALKGAFSGIPFVALLALLGLVLVLPVWIVPFPPLVDYPNHLARYFILAHLHDPNLHLAEFYASRWAATPYVAVDVLAVLLERFLPIYVTGRIILSLSLIALPLASYFFLAQISRESRYLASWVLVLAYGPIFLVGFINVALAAALCFLLLGLWLKFVERRRMTDWLVLLGVATLLYLTHLVGVVIAGVAILAHCLLTRQSLRTVFVSAAIFIPAGILYLIASFRGKSYSLTGANSSYKYHLGIADKVWLFVSPLRGYSHVATLVITALLLASVVAAVWRNREIRLNTGWTGVTAVMLFIYSLAPTNFHFMEVRIALFLFVFVLSVAQFGRRSRVLGAIGLLAFLGRSLDIEHAFLARQTELQQWHASFEKIPVDARIFPIVPLDEGAFFRRDYLHFWAYGVIERGWYSPNLFHSVGIHPLRLKQAYDQLAWLTWLKQPRSWYTIGNAEPNWMEVQEHFDYLWVFDVERFSPAISRFSDLIYSRDALKLYRVRHPRSP